jgi:hypothetical protein
VVGKHRKGYWAAYAKAHPERKKDRHKSRPSSHGKRALAYRAGQIVAIDGEGIQVGNKQNYAYLADSTGREIWEPDEIPPARALDFLCGIPQPSVVVGFGIGYDVEKILLGLPRAKRREIDRSSSPVWWGDYRIRYWPKKRFEVWRFNGKKRTGYCRVDDVLSNFGEGFEGVAKKWLGVEGGILTEGKARRGSFTADDLDYIRRYTGEELRLLVEVVRKLKDARLSAGFKSSSLYSPANLSVELLLRLRIRRVLTHVPSEMVDPSYRAFMGGRIEAVAYGSYDGPVWEYDINSAYPWALSVLPNLSKGTWRPVTKWCGINPPALYHVRWNFPEGRRIYPFAWRSARGGIYYPPKGEGWVWWPEIATPILNNPECVTVLGGWEFVGRGLKERPFKKIAETYAKRQRMKDAGDPAEFALKLALNSMYGKFAQRISATRGKPRFHDIVYAGVITSACRAKLYNACFDEDSVVTFNTDAAYLTKPAIFATENPDLGEWKGERYDGIQILQSGVFRLKKGGVWLPSKGRGFGDRSVPWDSIVAAWKEGRTTATVKLKDRFVSHRFADARARLELAGTWEPVRRTVNVAATGKRADLPNWREHNPATELRWTAPESVGISEFDVSAPNLPPWEMPTQSSQGKRRSRRPESQSPSAPEGVASREVST